MKDFRMTEMRVMERCDLNTRLIDQLGMFRIEPTLLRRLFIECGARIGSGNRNLNGVRINLDRKSNGLLDRRETFSRQPENEGAMNFDSKLMTVFGEGTSDIDTHAFADVIENVLI